ncbi:MAG: glutaminyl-peptide cyclotransferase [Bacteroidota bacterium]
MFVRIHMLLFLSIALLVDSCGNETDPSKLFQLKLAGKKTQFQQGETVGVAIQNKKEKTIQEVTYLLDGEALAVEQGKITIAAASLGTKVLKAIVNYDDTSVELQQKIQILASAPPKVYGYEVLNTYPHDKTSFTQGLEFSGDTLYESTGNPSKVTHSVLRKLNFKTGEVLEEVALSPKVFGEGLTLIDNRVIQLTWRSGLGYVYQKSDLQKIKDFSYGASKEGWGLCNDGTLLYKSDGTEKIWKLDPATLDEKGYIETVTNKSVFNKANELEYVNGKIYANVWQKPSMMIIDPTTGAIEGVINFGGLKSQVTQHPDLDVFNGVAYHKERGTFFVTGKNWDKLFEVQIVKR